MKTIFVKALSLTGLLLFSLVLAGELQSLHSVIGKPAPEPEPAKETMPGVTQLPGFAPLPSPEDYGISEIGIERTRCFGDCPAYTFIVSMDGSFRYVGEYGVEHMGEHTGTVSVGQLNQVMAFIGESGYADFQDTYSASFLDAPTVYSMVVQSGDTKVIENYGNTGPATLWAIEQLIDSLLETAEWNE